MCATNKLDVAFYVGFALAGGQTEIGMFSLHHLGSLLQITAFVD